MKKSHSKKKGPSRRPEPPLRSEDGRLIKALILKGLVAFEESFRRKYPRASQAVRQQNQDERARMQTALVLTEVCDKVNIRDVAMSYALSELVELESEQQEPTADATR